MWARATPPRCASTSGWGSNDTANIAKGSRPGCKQYILLFSLAGWLSLCIQCHDELVATRLTHLLLRSLSGFFRPLVPRGSRYGFSLRPPKSGAYLGRKLRRLGRFLRSGGLRESSHRDRKSTRLNSSHLG